MKRNMVLVAAMALVFIGSTAASFAQRMETWTYKQFNVSFEVPVGCKWQEGTESDGTPYVEALSPDNKIHIYVYMYKSHHVTTDELFNEARSFFEGNIQPIKGTVKSYKQSHFDVKSGDFMGTWSHGRTKEKVGAVIMAATDPDYQNNYVCYVTCLEKDYDTKLGATMDKIVDSFKALK